MKKLVLLLTIISHFVFGQNISTKYDATTKKSYMQTGVAPKANIVEYTDTVSGKSPIWQFDTPRIKYKNQRIETDTSKFDKVNVGKGDSAFWVSKKLISGSGAIDTLKVGRIAQGRGTTAGSMWFNGVAWVKNDTSYIPKNTNILNVNNFFSVGLSGYDNALSMFRNNNTSLVSKNITPLGGESNVIVSSLDSGYIQLGIVPSNVSYSRLFSIKGTNYTYPTKSFEFTNGLAHYNGDYRTYMIDDETIPDIGKVKQLISDSIAGSGGLTSVYSANSDILVDSSQVGKRKLTLNKTLTSGYIKIGDGTNTAFPRALSGDATVSNTGVVSVSNATNAGTATSLQTARTIGIATGDVTSSGSSFNGTANNTNALTVTKINGTSLAGLATGILKNTTSTGVPSIAVSGTDYEVPLTFSTGLTRATNTITNNLSTGVSGGQTLIGSTSTTSGITYKTTTGVGTTGADHVFVVGNNGATRAMTITNDAMIGIGTTTPVAQLHVSTDITNLTRGLVIDQHSTNAAAATLVFRKSRGTLLSPTAVADQDYIGLPIFAPYDGTSYLQSAGFGSRVNGTVATGSVPTDLFFYTGSGNLTNPYISGNVRMVINSTGNVGIGITSPTAQLHVSTNGQALNSIFTSASVVDAILYSGTKRLVHKMVVSNDTTIVRPLINFQRTGGSNTTPTSVQNGTYLGSIAAAAYDGTSLFSGTDITSIVNGTVSTGVVPCDMVFSTTATNTLIERMRINSTGNVGIGITSPTTGRLQISAGSATVAGFQLTNQTAYTGGVAGSISLENTNDISHVGNIVAKRGTTANIGTSDNQALQLVTNNTSRLSIGTSGIVTLTAALVGIASQDVFNTTSTTVNAFGAATSGTLFGTSTASVTYGIGNNATASGNTKAINIGTSGASGSTTNVVIGSSNSGANSTLTVNGTIKSTGYTVATLPTGSVGMRAYVTDALAPSYSATVVGGGAVIVSVFHNGTTWICN